MDLCLKSLSLLKCFECKYIIFVKIQKQVGTQVQSIVLGMPIDLNKNARHRQRFIVPTYKKGFLENSQIISRPRTSLVHLSSIKSVIMIQHFQLQSVGSMSSQCLSLLGRELQLTTEQGCHLHSVLYQHRQQAVFTSANTFCLSRVRYQYNCICL